MSDITWTNGTRKLSKLVPWEHNPKRMTKKQAEGLKLSIEHFGVALPFLISPQNDIYDGHQRQTLMNAMKEHGGNAEVDVRVSSRLLTDDERRELVIRLKQNQAGWDFDMLPNLYERVELLDWGFELEELGMFGDSGEPPSLEELHEKYGEPNERDFWPYIHVLVSPETMQLFKSFMTDIPGADEAEKVAMILGAVDATLLGGG